MNSQAENYRFAQEIFEHPHFASVYSEIKVAINRCPLFIFPKKSKNNLKLDVIQQLLNGHFERELSILKGWVYHPIATDIPKSLLRSDFSKTVNNAGIHIEVQFENMARWYSDIFKFQTAYSSGLAHLGVSIVPTKMLADRIDSNVVNFERCKKELPSAKMSITIPILLLGIEPDQNTQVIDVSISGFSALNFRKSDNVSRVINGIAAGNAINTINSASPIGQKAI